MNSETHSNLLISERLYNTLLNLYPVNFRAAHGWQMRLTFRDACLEAYSRGRVSGLLALWLPTLSDLIKTALEERARQGEISMTKERLVVLANPLLIAIGLLWVLASAGEFVLLVKWGSPDSFWDVFWLFPVALSFFLMIPAFMGVWLRFQGAATSLGRVGLTLNLVGCAGMVIFLLISMALGALGIEQETWPNYVIAVCFITPMIGHVLFGMDALRNNLLPRWNVMPVLVGLPTILLIVPSILIDGSKFNRFELTLITTFLRFALTGICWALLGYAILDRRAGRADVSLVDAGM